jgi:hypothetical protein
MDYVQDLQGGNLGLSPGFRVASVQEIRAWRINAIELRRLYDAAKESIDDSVLVDHVRGGISWKRNNEGHGALILRASVLQQALGPQH